MGKAGSKLPDTPSFDHIKSTKQSINSRKKNIPINSSSKPPPVAAAISVPKEKHPRLVESALIIWLDVSSEKHNDANQKTLYNFRRITNIVRTFTDLEKCYHFMNATEDEKIFFVVSGSFGPQILPRIENFEQIYSIYLFCGNKSNHIEWTKQYKKIKGIHTNIKELSDSLRYDYGQYDKGLTAISILPAVPITELNQDNKKFIYLQVLKSILLEINYDKKFREELIDYCRQFYLDNDLQLNIIDTFDANYNIHAPIWWYTRKCFIYRMLRKAFYEQDFEMIYKLAFFIRDLHRDVKKAYLQTHNHQYHAIHIYRAARMTNKEFDVLAKNQDGLLSFDDFVTTTLERSIALKFANKIRNDPNVTAVIYKLDVDPGKSSIPFIALNHLTYLSDSNGEILLSMNTIFHINKIEKVLDRLYEVSLSPAGKKDEQISNLVQYMQETTGGLFGWYRLSKILMDVKEYDQVEKIYKYIYEQTNETEREERAFLLHELGYIYDLTNNFPSSITHYQQAIEMYLHYLPANHPTLLSTYTNLASVLEKQGDLNAAFNQYQQILKNDKSDDPDIIIQYNNVASILQQQHKYSEAQQYYEKAIQLLNQKFPSARPLLTETYSNMAGLFYIMKDYSKALSYYEKTLAIEEDSLPSMVSTYFNLATTYEALNDGKQAIKYAEKAVEKARVVFGKEHLEVTENLQYLEQLKRKFQTVRS